MITVTLPIYYKQTKKKTVMMGLNWYRNVHFLTNNKVKMFIAGVIEDSIEGEPILEGKIHVHYKIFLKRKGSDGGNIRSVIEKYALDGIKSAGYITDDHADIIVSDSSEYYFDKEFPRAEITLTQI
jgi:hypothetical protein